MTLPTIKSIVKAHLISYECLWLHKNSNKLQKMVEMTLGHEISPESVLRSRRKLFEEGMRPKDNKVLEEYKMVRKTKEKEYREYFGKSESSVRVPLYNPPIADGTLSIWRA